MSAAVKPDVFRQYEYADQIAAYLVDELYTSKDRMAHVDTTILLDALATYGLELRRGDNAARAYYASNAHQEAA